MSYGSSDWASWVLNEEEGIKHIKAAYASLSIFMTPALDIVLKAHFSCSYDAGIQTFDTSDVNLCVMS